MFTNAENYNHGTGRLSRQLAVLFTDFVGVESGDHVLDVGCGTGSLALSIAANRRAARIVGVDPSAGFIEYARSQSADEWLEFQVGDAQNMPFVEASFDNTMALLVVGFFPDAASAARDQARWHCRGVLVGRRSRQRIPPTYLGCDRSARPVGETARHGLRFVGSPFILVEFCRSDQR